MYYRLTAKGGLSISSGSFFFSFELLPELFLVALFPLTMSLSHPFHHSPFSEGVTIRHLFRIATSVGTRQNSHLILPIRRTYCTASQSILPPDLATHV
jgi:hypothetical protein